MNTNCLNITKAIVMSAMLIGGTTLLAQAPQASSTVAAKPAAKKKFNRLSVGFRISHLYDIQYTGYDNLYNGSENAKDPSGLNGSKTKFDIATGFNLTYFISPKISFDGSYDVGKMTGANTNQYYESTVSFLTFGFNYDLKGNSRIKPYKLVPFLRASIAKADYDVKRKYISDGSPATQLDGSLGLKGSTMQLGLGAGMRYHFNNHWHVNLQSELIQTYTDAWDGWDYGSGKDYMAKTSLGLCFTFGNKMHIDRVTSNQINNNLVSNEVAKPADNSDVNNKMLALNDSLKNINDKLAKMQADNDQITKDTDGDGVPDFRDQCPEVKGTFVNGCNEMAGQKLAGTNDAKPAVTPANDKPVVNTPNPVSTLPTQNLSNSLKQELRSMLLVEMNKIYFETNKANLNATDKVILTQCAKVIMDNPSFKLTILGYADNVGNDEANFVLSKNRAENVAAYLENHGVNKNNITIKALGAQKMLGTDAKEANAYNRRVEFILE
jgi:outer membrane protein OmpA-like peptidoglycan-associated protein